MEGRATPAAAAPPRSAAHFTWVNTYACGSWNLATAAASPRRTNCVRRTRTGAAPPPAPSFIPVAPGVTNVDTARAATELREIDMRWFRFLLLTVLCGGSLAAAAADDPPRLKPGLWDIKADAAGLHGPVAQQMQRCVDEAMLRAQWTVRPKGSEQCSPARPRRDGDRYIVEAECKRADGQRKLRIATQVQGQTGYTTEARFDYEPPRSGVRQEVIKMVGRYVGACPAGMKPGDVRSEQARPAHGMPAQGMPASAARAPAK